MAPESLPRLTATRYVVPLREGGTLPAVVEVEDGSLWVVKFRGAGQGARALIAEILVGELAREAGLPVPELAVIVVPEALGRLERDPEIQDLLKGSRGVNVGIRYLEGAFNFEPRAAGDLISSDLAARIVWFDAWVTNPDRTPRNPNLMIHDGRPWLIDHGAALYGHFNWPRMDATRTRAPFQHLERHVLLGRASDLDEADRALAARLTPHAVTRALDRIPDELLTDPLLQAEFESVRTHRARYREFLLDRLEAPRAFARAAEALRRAHRERRPTPLKARR
ncbi:MAG: aminotransferase class I and II [Gemmatimonadales bacterium]|nr:MAG: aminotransferase class I and II [Gemmatimonadales bacterium]